MRQQLQRRPVDHIEPSHHHHDDRRADHDHDGTG
jgi:hypothetical protein